jgi:hypothetical protein
VVKIAAVVIVLLLGAGAIVYVVAHGSEGTNVPAATPAFTAGLTTWLSSGDAGASPIVLPQDLPGCVQHKLDPAQVSEMSGVKTPSSNISDETGIDVFRALKACDRAGAAEVLTGQENIFASLGVHDISQQECVMQRLIDNVAALPETTAGAMQPHIDDALKKSFPSCVPVAVALTQIVMVARHELAPSDMTRCIASATSSSITWDDLFADNTPAGKQKLQAAVAAAAHAC